MIPKQSSLIICILLYNTASTDFLKLLLYCHSLPSTEYVISKTDHLLNIETNIPKGNRLSNVGLEISETSRYFTYLSPLEGHCFSRSSA